MLHRERSGDLLLKIGDFGMAREMQREQMAETICGTPYYMVMVLFFLFPLFINGGMLCVTCVLSFAHTFVDHVTHPCVQAPEILRAENYQMNSDLWSVGML